ncbi:MAG: DUF309 domain-containing protein [Chloroflexota bacterium]
MILVHTATLGEAIAAYAAQVDIRWTLDFMAGGASDHQPIIAQVAKLYPALIVVELDAPAPWLPAVHSDPATRRIPVVAIAADDAARVRAEAAHADRIYTPDEFAAALPAAIFDNMRKSDQAEQLNDQCVELLPPLVLKGLHEFNAQEYFECHETLEAAWNQEAGPVREVYRAILQVGIAYYQIQRGNYRGAEKMFLRMVQWFAPLPDHCQGIDVAQLRADALAAHAHLEALGPERIKEFDLSLLKPIHYEGTSP